MSRINREDYLFTSELDAVNYYFLKMSFYLLFYRVQSDKPQFFEQNQTTLALKLYSCEYKKYFSYDWPYYTELMSKN